MFRLPIVAPHDEPAGELRQEDRAGEDELPAAGNYSDPHPPPTRAGCPDTSEQPCRRFACRYNLLVDFVRASHSVSMETVLRVNRVALLPGAETCALDVSERRGPLTLDEVGGLLGLTRERVRQIETEALRKLEHRAAGLRAYVSESDGAHQVKRQRRKQGSK